LRAEKRDLLISAQTAIDKNVPVGERTTAAAYDLPTVPTLELLAPHVVPSGLEKGDALFI
jgi:hypothetical protein